MYPNFQSKCEIWSRWPKGSCGPNNEATLIEINFAVSQSLSKVLIASCLDMTTYQSLWSRHVIPKQIDQRNPGGKMPYFSDDGLYGFILETYVYYTRVSKSTVVACPENTQSWKRSCSPRLIPLFVLFKLCVVPEKNDEKSQNFAFDHKITIKCLWWHLPKISAHLASLARDPQMTTRCVYGLFQRSVVIVTILQKLRWFDLL